MYICKIISWRVFCRFSEREKVEIKDDCNPNKTATKLKYYF